LWINIAFVVSSSRLSFDCFRVSTTDSSLKTAPNFDEQTCAESWICTYEFDLTLCNIPTKTETNKRISQLTFFQKKKKKRKKEKIRNGQLQSEL